MKFDASLLANASSVSSFSPNALVIYGFSSTLSPCTLKYLDSLSLLAIDGVNLPRNTKTSTQY